MIFLLLAATSFVSINPMREPRMPAAHANQSKLLNAMGLPTAPGCQLDNSGDFGRSPLCAALRPDIRGDAEYY
jgi:hypothetical protein